MSTWPAYIFAAGCPLNVSGRSEPGAIAAPFARMPIWADPIVTVFAPSALNRRTRTREPPMLARRIMRIVWFFSPGSDGGIPNLR